MSDPKAIDVGDLTEVVISAVSRALAERPDAQAALCADEELIIGGRRKVRILRIRPNERASIYCLGLITGSETVITKS